MTSSVSASNRQFWSYNDPFACDCVFLWLLNARMELRIKMNPEMNNAAVMKYCRTGSTLTVKIIKAVIVGVSSRWCYGNKKKWNNFAVQSTLGTVTHIGEPQCRQRHITETFNLFIETVEFRNDHIVLWSGTLIDRYTEFGLGNNETLMSFSIRLETYYLLRQSIRIAAVEMWIRCSEWHI